VALSLAVWQDIGARLRNLRGDMITQWQGDIDNRALEQAITTLGSTIQMWQAARPSQQVGDVAVAAQETPQAT
jgi:hypothetical protein